jgi:hypothetical protein
MCVCACVICCSTCSRNGDCNINIDYVRYEAVTAMWNVNFESEELIGGLWAVPIRECCLAAMEIC